MKSQKQMKMDSGRSILEDAKWEEKPTNKRRYGVLYLLRLLLFTSASLRVVSGVTDTIHVRGGIKLGETIVSSGGTFELGFFSPGSSNNWYVGMWYKKITEKTYVWVANRETPLRNTTGVLKVVDPGLLVLLNETNGVVWSSNASRSVHTPIAQLLDSGNLVVKDANDDREESYLWQSFEYPTDTYLPGMKFGLNYVTGGETYLSSWKTNEDPSPGSFVYHLDTTGYPQLILKSNNNIDLARLGPWNGLYFSGLPHKELTPKFSLDLIMNEKGVYFKEVAIDRSLLRKFTLSASGLGQQHVWLYRTKEWQVYLTIPPDACDRYKVCGAYGICSIGLSPPCRCLDKFVPQDPEGWYSSDWSNGCIRRTNLSCHADTFLMYSGLKLPDARNALSYKNKTLDECKVECLKTVLVWHTHS